jgi:hypothetical protein
MKDFTVSIYQEFLEAAINAGYTLTSYLDFCQNPTLEKVLVLRHDVDKRPENSLITAKLQQELGVKGTYYFRAVPESYDVRVIDAIAALGHEIGYHYEDMALNGGDPEKSLAHFEKWLAKLRKHYPVQTICMHGSPLSKFDNRTLWDHYDYKSYDLIAEPYFDTNFDEVLYITDTGRRWDGSKVAVRDKVKGLQHQYRSTFELIAAFKSGALPNKLMQNIHPQRWTDSNIQWWKELLLQNTKNVVKKAIFVGK